MHVLQISPSANGIRGNNHTKSAFADSNPADGGRLCVPCRRDFPEGTQSESPAGRVRKTMPHTLRAGGI